MKSAAAELPAALQPMELIEGQVTPGSLDDQVLQFPDRRPPRAWYLALAVTLTALGIGGFCMAWTLYYGIGTWGNNRPVAWGFGIINFVFWVGIGHAGTLISAILFLLRARWRNAVCGASYYRIGQHNGCSWFFIEGCVQPRVRALAQRGATARSTVCTPSRTA